MKIEKRLAEKAYNVTLQSPGIKAAVISGRLEKDTLTKAVGKNYVSILIKHISLHGCSGIKCKNCPLIDRCDKDASKSKDIASKVVAYAVAQEGSRNGA